MDRRAYLAGVAGAASMLAGCSAGGDDGSTPTVTPAPVPGSAAVSGPMVADGEIDPAAVGDGHVDALSGANARVAVEYAATAEDGDPVEIVRVLATLDGSAMTHRRYVRRPLEPGGTYRLFRGFWYDAGEAVARVIEAGTGSIYREPDDFAPPPAAERFERDGLVDTLAAFEPAAASEAEGYRLAADGLADPARLPTGEAVVPGRDGRLEARLESSGLVSVLDASAVASADEEPLSVRYRIAVTDRGATTVDRPSPVRTFEWFLELRAASPVRPRAGDPVGTGDPPGRSGS